MAHPSDVSVGVRSLRAAELTLPVPRVVAAPDLGLPRPVALTLPVVAPSPAVLPVGLHDAAPAVRSFSFAPPAPGPVSRPGLEAPRDRLPTVSIPLQSPLPKVDVDLQRVFSLTYVAGRYGRYVHNTPPDPPLSPSEQVWANELLKSAS